MTRLACQSAVVGRLLLIICVATCLTVVTAATTCDPPSHRRSATCDITKNCGGLGSNCTYDQCTPLPSDGYCDDACCGYGDCCSNFYTVCKVPSVTSVTPSRAISSSGGSVVITLYGKNLGEEVDAATISMVNAFASVNIKPFVSTWNEAQLIFNLPSGYGGDYMFHIYNMYRLTVTVTPTFSYDSPKIVSVVPDNGPTEGGTAITLTGTSFGAAPQARVTARISTWDMGFTSLTHTQFRGTIPSGQGTSLPLTLTVGNLPSNVMSFRYYAPIIQSTNPTKLIFDTFVTISGSSFGASGASVQIAGAACVVQSQNHNTIVCRTPQGCCTSQSLTVSLLGQTSSTFYVDYARPAITSITPQNGPTSGAPSTLVTISGTNFYTTGSMSFGTTLCPGPGCTVNSWQATRVVLTLPTGSGANLPVTLFVGDQQTDPVGRYSYGRPAISSINPTTGSTAGQISMTINGNNFGTEPTVTIDGAACPVTSMTPHTAIICTMPSGSGPNRAVVVSVNGQVNDAYTWSYTRPIITSATPLNGNTNGGYTITINGNNFGVSGSVRIGTLTCPPLSWSHTKIECSMPSGGGSNLRITVTVSTQASTENVNFSYNSPIVTTVSPTNGPTGGAVPITVSGNNFGTSGTVNLGSFSCPTFSHDHSQIVCTLPAGRGRDLTVSTDIAGQIATNPAYKFSYDDPIIVSATPLSAMSNGGAAFTVSGSSFDSAGVLRVGTFVATVTNWGHTTIRATIPAGQGASLPLTVETTGGRSFTTNDLTFSYTPPAVTSISPASGPTSGAISLTIAGTSLGTSATVSLGSINCPVTSQSHTQIICTLPVGQGLARPLVVTAGSQSSSPALFNYADPFITSIVPGSVETIGGQEITIKGTSFGTTAATVEMGGKSCPVTYQTHDEVRCTSPSGQGSVNIVLVVGGSQISNQVAYQYGIPSIAQLLPATPFLTKGGEPLTLIGTNFGYDMPTVQIGGKGCAVTFHNSTRVVCTTPANEGTGLTTLITVGGVSASNTDFNTAAPTISSVSAIDRSTTGGSTLTITGTNFGLSGTATIGGTTCQLITRTHEQITCQIPPGAGRLLPVQVIVLSQSNTASPAATFDYTAPAITSISPTTSTTQGGGELVITGTNFGPAGIGAVTVGGNVCHPTGTGWDHSKIVCSVPQGQGKDLQVVITRAGESATASTLFNYNIPSITNVIPASVDTSGNVPITLQGTNFGITATAKVNNVNCPVTFQTHTHIVCTIPAGQGTNLVVSAEVGGQATTTNGVISYKPPNVQGMTPTNGRTNGGTSVVIVGTSFGSTQGTVSLNGVAQTITAWSHTSITFTTVAGVGKNLGLRVTASSGLHTDAGGIVFNYNDPQISLVTPSVLPTGGTSNRQIQISGQSLWTTGTVTIAGQACTPVSWTHGTITCNAPEGQGQALPLIVTVNGIQANQLFFNYRDPIIDSFSPAKGPTAGGVPLTITGTSFGTSGIVVNIGNSQCPVTFQNHTHIICTLPAGHSSGNELFVQLGTQPSNTLFFDYEKPVVNQVIPTTGLTDGNYLITIVGTNFGLTGASITVGGTSCPVDSQNHTHVICMLPEGEGQNRVIQVGQGNLASSDTVSFSYSAPSVTSISPTSTFTNGLIALTVDGSSFGTSGFVTVGGQTCSPISQTHSKITCLVPPGQGADQPVIVTVGSQISSVSINFTYVPPTITGISPITGPTLGGTVIVVTGTSFGLSGTLTVGGNICTIVPGSYSHTSISCTVPSGGGENLPVKLASSNQVSNENIVYSYLKPSITSISPANGPTSGGRVVTVTGENFALAGTVTIGGNTCTPVDGVWGHLRVTCTLPEGTGTNVPVIVTATTGGNRPSDPANIFTYDPPTLTSLTPSVGYTKGGETLTLVGTNFGVTAGVFSVTIDGKPCTVVPPINHTHVFCTAPAGFGTNLNVLASADGKTSTNSLLYSYAPPTITKVTGCTDNGDVTEDCPIRTTTEITIHGTSLGYTPQTPTITVKNMECSNPQYVTPHEAIKCTLPNTVGFSLPVVVSLLPLSSTAYIGVSFAGPRITPNTIEVVSLTSAGLNLMSTSGDSNSNTDGMLLLANAITVPNTNGGQTIRFQGQFFGNDPSKITVTYGESPNYNRYTCTIVPADTTATQITCKLSAGVGKNHVFTVAVDAEELGQQLSPPGTDTVSYPAPIITANTIRSNTANIKSTALLGTVSNGQQILFNVEHLGTVNSLVSVKYGETGNMQYTCLNQEIVADGSEQSIRCTTMPNPGHVGPYIFQVTVLNQVSAEGSDTYTYPIPPTVLGVSGCVDGEGNTTSNCPTKGDIPLTLTGTSFSNDGISIRIGGRDCSPITFANTTHAICTLSQGAGANLPVVVTVGQLFSPARNLLSYAAPNITSVSGCTGTGTTTSRCARAGGASITLTGTNFGGSGASVFVGEHVATNVLHDPTTPHEKITFTLPGGFGLNRDILLLQRQGQQGSGVRVSYIPCPASTYENVTDGSCPTCPAGYVTATEGLFACSACSPGTIESGNRITCTNCPIGRVQPLSGRTTCNPCSAGHVAMTGGLTQCAPCGAGLIANAQGTTCTPCASGKFANLPSAATQCIDCAPGSYASTTGTLTCAYCNPGSYSFGGASQCTPCPKGSVQPNPGASKCEACTPGSYVDIDGQATCLACDGGSYTTAYNATSCDQCLAGNFSVKIGGLGPTTCPVCPTGHYTSVDRQQVCLQCPQGQYNNKTSQTICQSCPLGTFNDGLGKSACSPCGTGRYSDTEGAVTCKPCEVGKFNNMTSRSQCDACGIGQFQDLTQMTFCRDCQVGYSNNKEGQAACVPCNSGSFTNSNRTLTCGSCPAGTFSQRAVGPGPTTCTECPAGYYTASSGQATCIPCASGSFNNETKSTGCRSCPSGTYNSGTGKTACTACSPGEYATPGAAQCTSCPAGTFSNTSAAIQCTACPRGYYSAAPRLTICSQCAEGKFNPLTSQSSCTLCAAGKFSRDQGLTICEDCAAGSFQPNPGRSSCTVCPAGQFSNARGQIECTPCPKGEYAPSSNSTACLPCAKGKFSGTTGRIECSDCGVGSHAPAERMAACIDCNPGTFQNTTGSSFCYTCSIGTFRSNPGSASCVACDAGSYSKDEGNRICTSCEAGKYQPDNGATICKSCPKGEFNPNTGKTVCEVCEKGKVSALEGSVTCTSCAAGQYQAEDGKATCTPCEVGKFQSGSGMSVCEKCTTGYYNPEVGQASCLICPAGHYNNETGVTECQRCPAMTFAVPQGTQGATACTACVMGQTQPTMAQPSCMNCPAGTYGTATGCQECTEGKFQAEPGKLTCNDCPKGTYSRDRGALACIDCSLGTFNDETGKTSCKPCALGTYIKTTKAQACLACSTGYVAMQTGQADCVPCPIGSFRNTSHTVADRCESCPIGTYQPNTARTTCEPCAAGSYTSSQGQETCISCPPGTFSPSPNSNACTPCPAGFYTDAPNQISCQPCAKGKYSSDVGAFSCSDCPAGRFQNQLNSTQCEQCPFGTYVGESRAEQCLDCGTGRYAKGLGLTACVACSPGSFTNTTKADECTLCEMGKFQVDSGRTMCMDCARGTYNAAPGGLSCQACLPGTMAENFGSTACVSCGSGKYQDQPSASVCKDCDAGKASAGVAQSSCAPCPSGTFTNLTAQLECSQCIPGKFSVQVGFSGTTVCSDCLPGFFQASAGQERCTECSTGKFSNNSGVSVCQDCGFGKYNDQSQQTHCEDCGRGEFGKDEGSVACEKCSIGQYNNVTGKTDCSICDPGTFQNVPGSDQCTPCSPGTYQSEPGKSECLPCNIGKYSSGYGWSACRECEAGTSAHMTGQRSCDDCPFGSFQRIEGQGSCNLCQPGSYANATKSTVCSACERGKAQQNAGAWNCTACSIAQYMPEPGQSRCLPCPPGTYGLDLGQDSCRACEAGKFNGVQERTSCENCTIGRFSALGASECSLCETGSVNAVEGSPSCVVCNPTVSVADRTSTECLCNPGYFLPNYNGDYSGGYTGGNNFLCETCLNGADCRTTGSRWTTLMTLPGWWRATNTSRSFYRCPLPSYCPGGQAASAAYSASSGSPCAANREGVLCQGCAPGYKSGIGGICEACPDSAANWIIMILLLFFVAVLVILSIYLLWRSGDEVIKQMALPTGDENNLSDDHISEDDTEKSTSQSSTNRKSKNGDNDDDSSDDGLESDSLDDDSDAVIMDNVDPYSSENVSKMLAGPPPPAESFTMKLKIFLSFLQIATNVGSGLEIQWPNTFKSFVLFFDFANFDYILSSITSAECYSVVNYYTTFAAFLLFPPIVLAAILIFWVLPRHAGILCYKHMGVRARVRSNMRSWQLVLYFLFLIYPAISSTILYHFVCKDIQDSTTTYSYLLADLSVPCYTTAWYNTAYICIGLIPVYPLGIPALFMYLMYKHRAQLHHDPRIQAQFGFLYLGYRDTTWWWEMLDLFHKLFQTSILAFFETEIRMPIGMAVAITYMIAILLFNPYILKADDAFSLLCQNLIFLIMLAGYFFQKQAGAQLTESEDIGMSVALLVATLIFFLVFLFLASMAFKRFAKMIRDKLCPTQEKVKDVAHFKQDDAGEGEDDDDDDDDDDDGSGSGSGSDSDGSRSGSSSNSSGSDNDNSHNVQPNRSAPTNNNNNNNNNNNGTTSQVQVTRDDTDNESSASERDSDDNNNRNNTNDNNSGSDSDSVSSVSSDSESNKNNRKK